MSLLLPNGKVTAGYRTVAHIKVSGLNIFRDFCFKLIKKNKYFSSFLVIILQRFVQYTNCEACELGCDLSRSR